MSRITIKDLARRLSVNPSTVSRALHNHPDVGSEMKMKVQKLAEKLGYRPNQMAVSLRKGHSKTIGLIIPEISMFFFPSVIKAVEEETHRRNYNLLVLHSNDSVVREIENADICAFNSVEGVLVSLTRESFDIEHFSDLQFGGTPIVYFDKVLQQTIAHKIEIPGEQGAFLALNKLLQGQSRRRRICGIFGDMRLSITQDRIEGFIKALHQQGYQHQLKDIFFANSPNEAQQIMLQLHRSETVSPDVVFAMSDEILAGIIQAANQLQLSIPNQLQVVAMSDGYLPQLLPTPIPYVETSGYRLGKQAIKLLFDLIDGKPTIEDTYFIDTPFVAGKTK